MKTYDMLTSLEEMVKFLKTLDLPTDHPVQVCYTQAIDKYLSEFEKLKDMIEESIDISKVKHGEYIINPDFNEDLKVCLLYTSPSPRDLSTSRMPSSA